jgi:hypothetical protein
MDGLNPDRPIHFRQADAMLVFEVAWIFLAERRYEESANMFLRMQELNHWSVLFSNEDLSRDVLAILTRLQESPDVLLSCCW